MKRRTFSIEFKRSAVALVIEQKYTLAQAADNLGIGKNTLYSWLRAHEQRTGHATPDDERDSQAARGRSGARPAACHHGARHHKKSDGVLRQEKPVRYAWIKDQRNVFEVAAMCRVLDVSVSGFYASLKRPPSTRRLHRLTAWLSGGRKYPG